MKKILTFFITSFLLLTACGQVDDSSEISDFSSEYAVSQEIEKHIAEIEMHETGGEDGRSNHWHFFIDEDDKKTLVFRNRFDETKTYILSDDDYTEISSIDFSRYIGKKDDNEGVYDAVYYNVIIRYDDDTEEQSKTYISDLWQILNHFLYECESVEDLTSKNTDDSPVEDLGAMYLKEVNEDDIAIDEETGIKYVKNQLLISVELNTEKQLVGDIAKEIDAEIVGMIELTGDYQIEFKDDKTIDELEQIANYISTYEFVSNVTLNMIIENSYESADIE